MRSQQQQLEGLQDAESRHLGSAWCPADQDLAQLKHLVHELHGRLQGRPAGRQESDAQQVLNLRFVQMLLILKSKRSAIVQERALRDGALDCQTLRDALLAAELEVDCGHRACASLSACVTASSLAGQSCQKGMLYRRA